MNLTNSFGVLSEFFRVLSEFFRTSFGNQCGGGFRTVSTAGTGGLRALPQVDHNDIHGEIAFCLVGVGRSPAAAIRYAIVGLMPAFAVGCACVV